MLRGFILAATLTMLTSAPLPSPTPGLTIQVQQLNYVALTQGETIKIAKIYGREYTLRRFQDLLFLYNDHGHLLAIGMNHVKLAFGMEEAKEDPFKDGQLLKTHTFKMDEESYTAKYMVILDPQTSEEVPVFVMYDALNNLPIFVLYNPQMAIVPFLGADADHSKDI
jgi:hypothetical protein